MYQYSSVLLSALHVAVQICLPFHRRLVPNEVLVYGLRNHHPLLIHTVDTVEAPCLTTLSTNSR